MIALDRCTQFVLDVYDKILLKLCGVNQLKEGGCQQLVSSSGGNAGVAAAYVSQALGIPCTVFVPEWAQPACINLIRDNGAQVQVQTMFFLTRIVIKFCLLIILWNRWKASQRW